MAKSKMFIIMHIIVIATKKGTAKAAPKATILFAHEEAVATFAATDENLLLTDLKVIIKIISFKIYFIVSL